MIYSEKIKKEVIDKNSKILVKIEDVPLNSKVIIECLCDNCHKVQEMSYCQWNKRKHSDGLDFCKNCAVKIKLPKSMKEKYGYENCAKVPEIIEKKKQTNLKKYGQEWAISSKEVRQNIMESIYKKYKTDNPMKNIEVQNKAKQTNQNKYGGSSPMCDDNVKLKSINTCLEKYSVKNAFQCKEIQEKARKTLYKNNSVPSSKVEKRMCDMLIKLFGKENCFPNYPEGNLSLDCLVLVDGYKIDFEYDGFYWHKNRGQYDAARNAVLMNNGYKIIRIKGNNTDDLPTEVQIKKSVYDLINNNHNLIFINMN